jgi:hypothetical protein
MMRQAGGPLILVLAAALLSTGSVEANSNPDISSCERISRQLFEQRMRERQWTLVRTLFVSGGSFTNHSISGADVTTLDVRLESQWYLWTREERDWQIVQFASVARPGSDRRESRVCVIERGWRNQQGGR